MFRSRAPNKSLALRQKSVIWIFDFNCTLFSEWDAIAFALFGFDKRRENLWGIDLLFPNFEILSWEALDRMIIDRWRRASLAYYSAICHKRSHRYARKFLSKVCSRFLGVTVITRQGYLVWTINLYIFCALNRIYSTCFMKCPRVRTSCTVILVLF